jgi:Uma2 family endonuclease
MSLATKLNYTPEDLLSMPDRGRYDLIDGQLVARNMSIGTSITAALINARLTVFVLAHRSGWTFQADGGLQIFRDSPHKVRFADGAFISRERSPGRPTQGHLRIAPELVIEVVSPNDVAADVNEKVREYLAAGVLLIWVVYPEPRSIDVYRASANNSQLSEVDELSGEDVVPGFSLPVREIFDF